MGAATNSLPATTQVTTRLARSELAGCTRFSPLLSVGCGLAVARPWLSQALKHNTLYDCQILAFVKHGY